MLTAAAAKTAWGKGNKASGLAVVPRYKAPIFHSSEREV